MLSRFIFLISNVSEKEKKALPVAGQLVETALSKIKKEGPYKLLLNKDIRSIGFVYLQDTEILILVRLNRDFRKVIKDYFAINTQYLIVLQLQKNEQQKQPVIKEQKERGIQKVHDDIDKDIQWLDKFLAQLQREIDSKPCYSRRIIYQHASIDENICAESVGIILLSLFV